jgi:hypothetical protein
MLSAFIKLALKIARRIYNYNVCSDRARGQAALEAGDVETLDDVSDR